MRVVVVGSADWFDVDKARDELVKLPTGITIVCGKTGSHQFILQLAEELRFDVEEWPMQTQTEKSETHEPRATRIRNQEMIESGADLCVAFPVGNCQETWDCIRRARSAHIKTIVVR